MKRFLLFTIILFRILFEVEAQEIDLFFVAHEHRIMDARNVDNSGDYNLNFTSSVYGYYENTTGQWIRLEEDLLTRLSFNTLPVKIKMGDVILTHNISYPLNPSNNYCNQSNYCYTLKNEEISQLYIGEMIDYGDTSPSDLSSTNPNGYGKMWLLPRIKKPGLEGTSSTRGYEDKIFEETSYNITDGYWKYSIENGELKTFDNPTYKNKFPLNLTVEEFDNLISEDITEGSILRIEFYVRARGGGSFNRVETSSNPNPPGATSIISKEYLVNSYIFDVIQNSPKITSTTTTNTTCSDEIDGTVTFTFEEQLQDGYDMRFYVYDADQRSFFSNGANLKDPELKEKSKENGFPEVFGDYTITAFNTSNQATLTGLTANIDGTGGTSQKYFVVYQSIQYGGDNVVVKSGEISDNFTIQSPTPVSISRGAVVQPQCEGDTGSVTVTASGGKNLAPNTNGKYYFTYDGLGEWKQASQATPMSYTFPNLSPRAYTFKTKLVFPSAIECESSETVAATINPVQNPLKFQAINKEILQQPTYQGASNGEVRINISQGVPPYRYELLDSNGKLVSFKEASNNISEVLKKIPAGSFTAKVTDANGCSIETSVGSFSAPPKIRIASSEEKQITCYGAKDASITVIPKDGYSSTPPNTPNTPNYRYKWFKDNVENPAWKTNKIENLEPGTYKVLVADDNNDFTNEVTYASNIFTIKEVTPVTINSLTTQDISCYGAGNGKIVMTLVSQKNCLKFMIRLLDT